MGSYRGMGLMAAMCMAGAAMASMPIAAAPMEPEARRRGRSSHTTPPPRAKHHDPSSSLSKMLAKGRRRGRV